jgi:hypothetical protein
VHVAGGIISEGDLLGGTIGSCLISSWFILRHIARCPWGQAAPGGQSCLLGCMC